MLTIPSMRHVGWAETFKFDHQSRLPSSENKGTRPKSSQGLEKSSTLKSSERVFVPYCPLNHTDQICTQLPICELAKALVLVHMSNGCK